MAFADVLSLAAGVWRVEDRTGEARLKELENGRLRKALSDLTLDKLILTEAAKETSKPRASARLHRRLALARLIATSILRCSVFRRRFPYRWATAPSQLLTPKLRKRDLVQARR